MLISPRQLVDRIKHPRSRAEELSALAAEKKGLQQKIAAAEESAAVQISELRAEKALLEEEKKSIEDSCAATSAGLNEEIDRLAAENQGSLA